MNQPFDLQAFGKYGNGGKSSTLKRRDYKDVTDLVINKDEGEMHDSSSQSGMKYVVRRLTPLECCRLQGFPDWWIDGVEGSDSSQYKMWGNGLALPVAAFILERIAKEYERYGEGGESNEKDNF